MHDVFDRFRSKYEGVSLAWRWRTLAMASYTQGEAWARQAEVSWVGGEAGSDAITRRLEGRLEEICH
jgi:hypothetical protein